MSATQQTTHYQLPIFEKDDIPSWLGDFNDAMDAIDTAIYQASQTGGTPIDVVQTTGQSTENVMSQKAVTDAINGIVIPPAITITQTPGNSQTEVMSQNAVTTALNTKQATLVSGGTNQNIKTINGQSILGQGDLPISGLNPTVFTSEFNSYPGIALNALTGSVTIDPTKTYLLIACAHFANKESQAVNAYLALNPKFSNSTRLTATFTNTGYQYVKQNQDVELNAAFIYNPSVYSEEITSGTLNAWGISVSVYDSTYNIISSPTSILFDYQILAIPLN